jgi:hypothetical protein
MLRQEVRRVGKTRDFVKTNPPAAHRLLDPQRVCVQVAKFAKTLARAYAYGCRGVSPHSDWDLHSKVSQ